MKKTMQFLLTLIMLCGITTAGLPQTGVHITINPSPTLYSVTGGGTYCAGLSGVPVGCSGSDIGITYQLQNGGVSTGLPLQGTGNALNFGNQLMPGIYTILATNPTTGCSVLMSNSATITVNPIPAIILTANGPVSFCGSGTVTLTAQAAGCTFQWYKNGAIIPGANLNQYVANTTGDFKVIATNGTGCSNDHDTMVIVNPLPQQFTVSASSPSFCEGGLGTTIELNSSENGINYQLLLNGLPIGIAVAGTGFPLAWPNQAVAGTYSIIAVNNATTCTNTMLGSVVVSMDPLPATAGTINGPTSICQGVITSFSTNAIANATSYTWSVPTGATIVSGQGTGQVTVDFTGASSGNIAVFGQNGCGAGQPSLLAVTVNTAPIVIPTASATDICAGASTTLIANGNGTIFAWSGGGTTQTLSVTPNVTTTYTVTVTGANSCTTTGNITVNVHPLPTVTLALAQNSFCTDVNSAVLSGGSPAGGTYSGSCVFAGNTVYPPVTGAGTYPVTYTYIDTWGCSADATAPLTINPTPSVMFTNVPGQIKTDTPPFDLMTFVSPTGGTFSGPGIVAGSSMFDPSAAGGGNHMITYTYTHPITGCSASQIQYITIADGVPELSADVNKISIYPNPASNVLNLQGINTKNVKSFTVMDMIGQVVYSAQIKSEAIQIDVSGFVSGTYLIRFMDADGLSVCKQFIKTE